MIDIKLSQDNDSIVKAIHDPHIPYAKRPKLNEFFNHENEKAAPVNQKFASKHILLSLNPSSHIVSNDH